MALAHDLLADAGLARLDCLRARLRNVGDLHRAATDDCAAAGAGAKLGKGHSDRHRFLFLSRCRCKAPPTDTRFHLRYNRKGQSFVNAAIALTAFACPRAGNGTRNQQKSQYLSQNRTDSATILCDWLTFGPKSPHREARRPIAIGLQNRACGRAGSSPLHGSSLSAASALVSSRAAGYRRASPRTAWRFAG